MNQALGGLLVIGAVAGYYMDFLLVRFLFRLGQGIAEWLGGPEVIGTGIGFLLVLLLMGMILGIFIFSSIGLYAGYSMIVGRPWHLPRRH
jgi:hypothetical protein